MTPKNDRFHRLAAAVAVTMFLAGCGSSTLHGASSTTVTTASVPTTTTTATTRPSARVIHAGATVPKRSARPRTGRQTAAAPVRSNGVPQYDSMHRRSKVPTDRPARGGFSIPGRPPARTLPNGTVEIDPATPTTTVLPASNACAKSGSGASSQPPPPGLRARIDGSEVVVDLDTGRLPAACAPAFAVVVLTRTQGRLQTGTHPIPIRTLGLQHARIAIPSYFAGPPNIVGAYLLTSHGAEGRVASVAIGH